MDARANVRTSVSIGERKHGKRTPNALGVSADGQNLLQERAKSLRGRNICFNGRNVVSGGQEAQGLQGRIFITHYGKQKTNRSCYKNQYFTSNDVITHDS